MRTFTREPSPRLSPDETANDNALLAKSSSDDVKPPRRAFSLPRVRPSLFIFVIITLAAWEMAAPQNYKPSSLVGSVSGSIQSAMMRSSMVSRAEMEAAVEAAKLGEQVRYQPLIGALDTVFRNCQAQTQALAQAQAQLIAQRAALTSDGVRGRMSSGGSFETMGGWLNGLSPGSGDGLRDFGRAERDAAMREFERQALAEMPQIQLQGGICGDDPTALLQGMGVSVPPIQQ